jgi:hypothetical protein
VAKTIGGGQELQVVSVEGEQTLLETLQDKPSSAILLQSTRFVLVPLIKASKFEAQVKEVGHRKLDEHHGGKVMLHPLSIFLACLLSACYFLSRAHRDLRLVPPYVW